MDEQRASQRRINGPAVRAIRERSGLTIESVTTQLKARYAIDLHPDSLRKIERGERDTKTVAILAVAAVLACPPEAISREPLGPIDISGWWSTALKDSDPV